MRKSLGVCLVLAGILLLLMPQIKKVAADHKQDEVLAAFERLGELQNGEQAAQQDTMSNRPLEQSALTEGVRGVLSISKIDLEIPVYDGVSEETLDKGVGIVDAGKTLGKQNVGIAGHRAVVKGMQFNRLNELAAGDSMSVKTKEGLMEFVVTDMSVVHQSDISVLDDQEKPLLTLITCTPVGAVHPPDRLIVQGELKYSSKH